VEGVQSKGFYFDLYKSGELHEKLTVTTLDFGTISAFFYKAETEETKNTSGKMVDHRTSRIHIYFSQQPDS
jgi:hypothetical protein